MKKNNYIEKENFKTYSLKEKKLIKLEEDLIRDFIRLRKDLHLTQKEMGEEGKVIRETIARIENQITSPQINTLIKILEPFGYTIKITKIDE